MMVTSLVQKGCKGSRVRLSPVRKLLQSNCAKHNKTETRCTAKAFTNGVWTVSRCIGLATRRWGH